jgi:hypothetical protein
VACHLQTLIPPYYCVYVLIDENILDRSKHRKDLSIDRIVI